jgi:glycosyltransferase involved in cell wall biosynthesis
MNAPSPNSPLISVVIASVNGMSSIGECLDALTQQQGNIRYEVLVVDRCGEKTREQIRRRFPQSEIQLVEVAGHPSIPKLRAMGIARARGQLIAILEDHCNVPPAWFCTIIRSHEAGHEVMSGPVENGAVDRIVDWAVFFCEYARFMPPMPRGTVDEIAGNCAIYAREVLDRIGPELREELWEPFLHARIREMGIPFYNDPALTVVHKKEFGFWYFVSQRYHYSRSFAGMRMRAAPIWKRMAYAAGCVLLPALLFGRIMKTVFKKGRHRLKFLLAAPAIAVFLISWACGEAVGALCGPGNSLARVE